MGDMFDILNVADWAEAFAAANGVAGSGGWSTTPAPVEGSGALRMPFDRGDVSAIFFVEDGEPETTTWIIIGQLSDDRYFHIEAGHASTGWNISSGHCLVADTWGELLAGLDQAVLDRFVLTADSLQPSPIVGVSSSQPIFDVGQPVNAGSRELLEEHRQPVGPQALLVPPSKRNLLMKLLRAAVEISSSSRVKLMSVTAGGAESSPGVAPAIQAFDLLAGFLHELGMDTKIITSALIPSSKEGSGYVWSTDVVGLIRQQLSGTEVLSSAIVAAWHPRRGIVALGCDDGVVRLAEHHSDAGYLEPMDFVREPVTEEGRVPVSFVCWSETGKRIRWVDRNGNEFIEDFVPGGERELWLRPSPVSTDKKHILVPTDVRGMRLMPWT